MIEQQGSCLPYLNYSSNLFLCRLSGGGNLRIASVRVRLEPGTSRIRERNQLRCSVRDFGDDDSR